ncbi:MAG: AAA family ATPase, partial [Chloroflexi bacterium]|nr:AAA family ATPase [Chloroflexota bacterium]
EPRERQAGILRGKTDSLLRKLQAMESALDAARGSYSAEEHVRIRQEYLAEQNRLTAAQAQLAFKQERLQVVNQLIARLRVNQLELGQRVEELAQSRHAQEVLELIRAWLKEAGPQVTRRLVNRISHEASLIYSDIIGDHTGWLHWGTDYELELEIGGSRRTFRQLSGGEQMIAALALRLALLRHTSAIDIAFFDEPTAHLDPERRDNLADKLTQVKGFSQVFVISHDDTFERSASKYIRIAKGENGSYLEDRL